MQGSKTLAALKDWASFIPVHTLQMPRCGMRDVNMDTWGVWMFLCVLVKSLTMSSLSDDDCLTYPPNLECFVHLFHRRCSPSTTVPDFPGSYRHAQQSFTRQSIVYHHSLRLEIFDLFILIDAPFTASLPNWFA